MSYTVIHDQEYEQRLMVNEINKAVRHCRIGKVTAKQKSVHVWPRFVLPLPHDAGVFGSPIPVGVGTVMDHPRNCVANTYG